MDNKRTTQFSSPELLMKAAKDCVIETDVALDIGCGIVPMNYFRPKLHILAEPWHEYADILRQRHQDDKSILILGLGALELLKSLQPNSVDSVFMLDVIEHLERDVGEQVIVEIERVCRRQAVLFTPLGFMPQHMEQGENDAWGLSGGEMQEHKSGWLPKDFGDEWDFLICEEFHTQKFNGDPLQKPFGAFFAIRNFGEKPAPAVTISSDLRKPLPSELKVDELRHELFVANMEAIRLREALSELESKIENEKLKNKDLQTLLNGTFTGKLMTILLRFRKYISKYSKNEY